jgi:hypothetical protein
VEAAGGKAAGLDFYDGTLGCKDERWVERCTLLGQNNDFDYLISGEQGEEAWQGSAGEEPLLLPA